MFVATLPRSPQEPYRDVVTTRIDDISGRWTLTAHGAVEGGETLDRDVLASWLDDIPNRVPDYAEAAGLGLTIASDGTVGQVADSQAATVQVFSHDGVLTDPTDADGLFHGRVRQIGDRLFVLAAGVEPHRYQRLDDGDTAITDELRLDGDELERIVSIAVDGIYLYRFAYRYRRVA